MSVTPEIPVSTWRNSAFFPFTTKTPCTSSFLGSVGPPEEALRARHLNRRPSESFAPFAASSKSLRGTHSKAPGSESPQRPFFRQVLIFAVVESPVADSPAAVQRNHYLKSFRFLCARRCLRRCKARAAKARPASRFSVTFPWNSFPARINGHIGVLPHAHVHDSVSSTFTSAVTTDMSESVMMKLPVAFLHSHYHIIAYAPGR